MSYKEKFKASQDKAHYQAIATKILSHMSDLRSLADSSKIAPRRWVWELIQNAKDININGKVKIKIDLKTGTNERIVFKHNGKPFTADNIRFLIEQISTKDRSKDEEGKRKTTGKFGTGFLTTHLLSEKVKIKAVAKEPDLDYRIFDLELDRSGFDLDDITESVKKSKEAVENLDDLPPHDYTEGAYNTLFAYHLTDQTGKTVAQKGLEDLKTCLPYVLTFVEEIESVELVHENLIYEIVKSPIELSESIMVNIVAIRNTLDENASIEKKIVTLVNNFTIAAVSIDIDEKGQVFIRPTDENIPTFFCDFPLVGTELFPFPVNINNPHFNPTDPRDGIFLTESERSNPKIDENKEYVSEAIDLYFDLLEYAAKENWKNLHLLAQINNIKDCPTWLSESWFNKEVLKPIRKKLLYAKIVRTASEGEPTAILLDNGGKYMWFPSAFKKDIRDKIWGLAGDWFPHCLPHHEDIEIWYRLSWDDCGKLTLDKLAEFVESQKTLDELKENLKSKDVHEWLKEFYLVLKLDEKSYDTIINKRVIFPNQNGDFCKHGDLWNDSGDIKELFKDVLKLLGDDIREELVDPNLEFDIEKEKVRGQSYVVKEITTAVLQQAGQDIEGETRAAFDKLLVYFRDKPESAKALFSELYRRKHILYDEEVIAVNIEKAEQLTDLLEEFGATDVNQLRLLLEDQNKESSGLLSITEEILVGLGITSPEEWEEALKDQDLADLFAHESVPSTDMFFYAQSLIQKAREKVLEHLGTMSEYDLTNVDIDTAPTIIAGVRKNGIEISIVTRPAYNSEVIIYYGSERDVLDYEDSELWVDTVSECKRITFGHILKKAQIRKFPI